jgi:hypothetical protein
MWIDTPDSPDKTRINLCEYARVEIEQIDDNEWVLIAYKSKHDDLEWDPIKKSKNHDELFAMKYFIETSERSTSFAPTTPTFH